MQQGLGGDATPVQAHAAGIGIGIDERHAHPEIGRVESGRISPGTAADDSNLDGNVRRHEGVFLKPEA
jgi:hypothetical protein